MMMTPIFKKLNYKGQNPVIVLNSPDSFADELVAMQNFATIITDAAKVVEAEFVMCFVTTQPEIDTFISTIYDKLKGDAILWVCYPKSSSKKYKCDFNRDTGFTVLGKYGLEGVRQVAVDEDWSALRFRKVEYIKTITRRESFAMTSEAKQRTTKKGQ
jgi:hypothetical protein